MTKVYLVAATQPLVPGISNLEEFIAYTARVSNPGNQFNNLTAPKLLAYLINHKHWSPFEMASATLEIQTTRDISHQIIRHRSFSFQEFSQRYAIVDLTENSPVSEARRQDTTNRQNSLPVFDKEIIDRWSTIQTGILNEARKKYAEALDMGIAKELARKLLPEGLTNTTLYMTGSIRSWIHYISIRSDKSTQKEHREVAGGALVALRPLIPSIADLVYD